MEVDTYMSWVKDVNLEASKIGKCLSCYYLNSDTLSGYYTEGLTPLFAVLKLNIDGRVKDRCVCKESGMKK